MIHPQRKRGEHIRKHDDQHETFGQLVVLGFDVTVFTPAPYQRRSLRRP